MSAGLTPLQVRNLIALMNQLVPGDELSPASGDSGGADYVNGLLTAFDFDPPHIWAGGPFSGRSMAAAVPVVDGGLDCWRNLGDSKDDYW